MNSLAAFYVFVVNENNRKIAEQHRYRQIATGSGPSLADRVRAVARAVRVSPPNANPA